MKTIDIDSINSGSKIDSLDKSTNESIMKLCHVRKQISVSGVQNQQDQSSDTVLEIVIRKVDGLRRNAFAVGSYLTLVKYMSQEGKCVFALGNVQDNHIGYMRSGSLMELPSILENHKDTIVHLRLGRE